MSSSHAPAVLAENTAEVKAVVVNEDGSGYLWLWGGKHLNFEAAPHDVTALTNRVITLMTNQVLLGAGVRTTLIAYRVSPKRVRFVGTARDWFRPGNF